ncbi:hypothetical protein, partial [Pseudomonas aeruginosa]|uniref:hypothetical protein n=1 Tax=Pseudomonas aeruginosa TaxID=287 RepID=UPI003F491D04
MFGVENLLVIWLGATMVMAAAYEPDVFGTAGQVAGQAYYDALAAQRSLAASRQ